jgi:23S rRNA G2069 N7-methylase RlmK/C1962 C5-methylase RlmI
VTRAGRDQPARRTARLIKPLRERIRAGHPWIYDRALAALPREVAAGEVVTVVDDEGDVALALADPDSPIRARQNAAAATPSNTTTQVVS